MLVRQLLVLHALSRSNTFLTWSWPLLSRTVWWTKCCTSSKLPMPIMPLQHRSMAAFAPTAANMVFSKRRIPTFYDRADNDNDVTATDIDEADGGPDTKRRRTATEEGAEEVERQHFPDGVRPGAVMDVRIVRVHDEYVLVRPVDYPRIKGKINNNEISELHDVEEGERATSLLAEKDIYRAVIMSLRPPDKAIFSLRRVRRVLRDDFQPFTVAVFNVPAEMDGGDVERLMEKHGKILEVEQSPYHDEEPNKPCFVTFLHQDDGMAAIKQWNRNVLPVAIYDDQGEEKRTVYRRLRCKKSHHQTYRDSIQRFLDYNLSQKIIEWDKTPAEKRIEARVAYDMQDIIPWYYIDQETQRQSAWMTDKFDAFPQYTIKNNARKAIPSDKPPENVM